MGTVTKVLMISLLMVAGPVTAQPATNVLDAATRKEAEATLARGVAWLQTQQGPDGRIGTNEHAAVTALALRAMQASGARRQASVQAPAVRRQASSNSLGETSETLAKAEGFIKGFVAANGTNAGMAQLNVGLCRNLLGMPGAGGKSEVANAWANLLSPGSGMVIASVKRYCVPKCGN